jgi:hypothetical protein
MRLHMNAENIKSLEEVKELFLTGTDLALKKLIKEKAAKGGEFAFLENGKVVRVKAKDLLK